MRLGPQAYVDARASLDVLARYINDPRDSRAHNVVFDKRPHERRAIVRATRYIAPGEELYASYGGRYWAAATAAGCAPSRLPDAAATAVLQHARKEARRLRLC